MIVGLLRRTWHLAAFYTDAGVLPREALFADYNGSVYSPHTLSGEPCAQLLFGNTAAVALALVVGYRSRIATILTWLLLVSLHARSPHVLNGGDVLLRSSCSGRSSSRWASAGRSTRAGSTATDLSSPRSPRWRSSSRCS